MVSIVIHIQWLTLCFLCVLQPGSSRPNTAPGKMQRPVRLKPIHSNSTTASLRRSSPYRLLDSSNGNDQPFNCTVRLWHMRLALIHSPIHVPARTEGVQDWLYFFCTHIVITLYTDSFHIMTLLTSLPDGQGVPQTFDHNGGLPWHLTLLPPSHQQLCHTCASSHEEEREGREGHSQRHAQRPQTTSYHCLQWCWRQWGLYLSFCFPWQQNFPQQSNKAVAPLG